jgi:hypothetical protein
MHLKLMNRKKCFKFLPFVVILLACIYLLLVITLSKSYHHDPWYPWNQRERKVPKIAIGVLVTPGIDAYWNRFITMSDGWYKDFNNITGYTFDSISSRHDTRLIRVERNFPDEKNASGWAGWTNIPLAAFQHMGDNTAYDDADWYLQVDEDTIIVPTNLKRLVSLVSATRPLMIGKCATFDDELEGLVQFDVGGAGILINRALMSALRPQFTTCRKRFNPMYYSDARIGACVSIVLNQSDAVCPGPNKNQVSSWHTSEYGATRI